MSDWVEQHYQEQRTKKKGGPGSGHWGHAGRPGKRGGSLPGKGSGASPAKGLVLPDDITRMEFVDAGLWKKRGYDVDLPVYVRESTMPPVKSGFVRFYHGTWAGNARPISKQGLKPGKETESGEQLGMVLGVAGQRSGFGDVNIVADLPEADVHMINDQWAEVYRTIEPSEMRGILLTKMSTKDPAEIIPIYREWQERGGGL